MQDDSTDMCFPANTSCRQPWKKDMIWHLFRLGLIFFSDNSYSFLHLEACQNSTDSFGWLIWHKADWHEKSVGVKQGVSACVKRLWSESMTQFQPKHGELWMVPSAMYKCRMLARGEYFSQKSLNCLVGFYRENSLGVKYRAKKIISIISRWRMLWHTKWPHCIWQLTSANF